MTRAPNITASIAARMAELYSEAPGDYVRISRRVFRECGYRYSTDSIKRALRRLGIELDPVDLSARTQRSGTLEYDRELDQRRAAAKSASRLWP